MATIIHRKNELINRFRDVVIYINGKPAGRIASGETREFQAISGINSIRAEIDWCGSRELAVDLSGTSAADLQLSGSRYTQWLLGLTIIALILLRILDRHDSFNLVLPVAAPAILALVYDFTIGRNKYLHLEERMIPGNLEAINR